MNINVTSVSVCVYTEIMLCVCFVHVLTYFYTIKEAISLTYRDFFRLFPD